MLQHYWVAAAVVAVAIADAGLVAFYMMDGVVSREKNFVHIHMCVAYIEIYFIFIIIGSIQHHALNICNSSHNMAWQTCLMRWTNERIDR